MIEVITRNSAPEAPKIRPFREKEKHDTFCQQFKRWLHDAKPGERYCYYVGDHICGILVGRTAYGAYEEGEVILFQKKEGTKFGYWAQKRSRWH